MPKPISTNVVELLYTVALMRTEPVEERRAVVSVLMDALREKYAGDEVALHYIEERLGPALKCALGLEEAVTPEKLEELEELDRLMEALLPYYHRYAEYVARITDPASPSHPDRMQEIGRGFRRARKAAGLSKDEVAQRMGADPVQLAAFEGGLIPSDDLPEGFVEKLKVVLLQALEPKSKG